MENDNNNNNNNNDNNNNDIDNDNGDQNRLDKGRDSLFATNELLRINEYLNSLPPNHKYSPEQNHLRSFYLQSIPPGCRFDPSDDELIVEYLIPKIDGKQLPINLIHEIHIYEHNPEDLAEQFIPQRSKEGLKCWYYFTPRDKKYPKGGRPNRAAGNGFWKATGADKPICRNSIEVGKKKTLVFFKGPPQHGEKTHWIMHEYQVSKGNKNRKDDDDSMRLDDHVLCRIYEKVPKKILDQRKAVDKGVHDGVNDEPSSSLDDKFSPPIPNDTDVHHNTNTDGQSYRSYLSQNQVNTIEAGQNQINYFDGSWNNITMYNYGNIGYPNQVNNGYMYNTSNYGGSHNNHHHYDNNNNTMTTTSDYHPIRRPKRPSTFTNSQYDVGQSSTSYNKRPNNHNVANVNNHAQIPNNHHNTTTNDNQDVQIPTTTNHPYPNGVRMTNTSYSQPNNNHNTTVINANNRVQMPNNQHKTTNHPYPNVVQMTNTSYNTTTATATTTINPLNNRNEDKRNNAVEASNTPYSLTRQLTLSDFGNFLDIPFDNGILNLESFPDGPSNESSLEYLNFENLNADDQFLLDLENPTMPDAANAFEDDKRF